MGIFSPYSTRLKMYPKLETYITGLYDETNQIDTQRKELLSMLAEYIRGKTRQHSKTNLNFICTHNSRRSQISQVWATALVHYSGFKNIECYSGGTEVTEFNIKAVSALERAGFRIENPGGRNPHYMVTFSDNCTPLECFSKTFDDLQNPQNGFAAVMTCSDADENCPFIPGTELRLPLTYEDPKLADNTNEEADRYDERVRQIGRELLYTMQLLT